MTTTNVTIAVAHIGNLMHVAITCDALGTVTAEARYNDPHTGYTLTKYAAAYSNPCNMRDLATVEALTVEALDGAIMGVCGDLTKQNHRDMQALARDCSCKAMNAATDAMTQGVMTAHELQAWDLGAYFAHAIERGYTR